VTVGNIQLRLPTPEDLIIMKAVAHRPKDIADIQAIAASHPSLDKERIRSWVEQFGEALELPDLWKMISQLLWLPPSYKLDTLRYGPPVRRHNDFAQGSFLYPNPFRQPFRNRSLHNGLI